MASSSRDQVSFKDSVVNYLKGVRLEWGKITWPDKQQVIVETIYVIGIVIVFTLLVLLLDLFFKGVFDIIKEPSVIFSWFNQ